MPNLDLPPERKALHYIGLALCVIGGLLFFSVFVSSCSHFGNFDNFQGRARSEMGRALGGMALMIVGSVLMKLGRSGAAGSGLKLDPRQTRTDLEPWSRASGGMLKDALDEAGLGGRFSAPNGGARDAEKDLSFDEKLRRLDALQREGLISAEEFQAARKRVLDSIS